MLDRLYLLKLLSRNICILYEEASYYLSNNNYARDKRYKEILDKIRELIIIEDKIISGMQYEELETLYNVVGEEFKKSNYEDIIIERICNRISHQLDCKCEECVKAKDIDLEDIFPEDTMLSIADIIHSKFSIDMFKILKRLINSLKPSTMEDKRFIEDLKRELELSKGDLFAKEVNLEAISLFYDNDIECLPDIDFKVFSDLAIMSEDTGLEDLVNCFLEEKKDETFKLLGKFINTNNMIVVDNNPFRVYEFLMVIARIEAIIPYLSMNELNNYLILLEDGNIFIGEHTINVVHVKNMIRKRMKEM